MVTKKAPDSKITKLVNTAKWVIRVLNPFSKPPAGV